MHLNRLIHHSRHWQPIVTEWPRPPGIALSMPSAIPLAWMTTLEGGPAAKAGGAGITWQIDLVLGFMAIPGETAPGQSHGVACLLLRPLLGPALDGARLAESYCAWHQDKRTAWLRHEDGPPAAGYCDLTELVLTPTTGPALACMPVHDELAAWRTVSEAWDETERYRAASRGSASPTTPVSKLLQDQPYMLAFEDTPQQLWDSENPENKPTADSCADLVPAIEPPTGRGRPRSFAPMVTAMATTDALIALDGDRPQAHIEAHDGRLVDMRALFAMELVLQDTSMGTGDRDRLASWLLGGHDRPPTAADLRRRSRDLRKKLDFWHTARKTGRRDTTVGANEIRKIVPTIIFDRSMFLKPLGDDGADPLEDTDATLVDWLRSPRVEELMDIVTGRRRHLLTMRCTTGGFDGFMEKRVLPFHRTRVLFRPEDEGYRGAVAMIPGAQIGAPAVLDLTGFAEGPEDLLPRWLGRSAGTVISTHTVPAGQPWPPLASSITSPPSSFGT